MGEGASPPPSRRSRFERYTEAAKQVLVRAQEEAQRFNHPHIGTEHLLLGVIRAGGPAADLLAAAGLALDASRTAVVALVGRGDRMVVGEIALTPRARHVLDLTFAEADRLVHARVGPGHLLLALLHDARADALGNAARVLTGAGVRLEVILPRAEAAAGCKE